MWSALDGLLPRQQVLKILSRDLQSKDFNVENVLFHLCKTRYETFLIKAKGIILF